MKIIHHDKLMKPETMTLGYDPLVIWLDRKTELRIRYGDRCGQVADAVVHIWKIDRAQALKLVTYWFAIGMRVHSHLARPWETIELKVDRNRRYLA